LNSSEGKLREEGSLILYKGNKLALKECPTKRTNETHPEKERKIGINCNRNNEYISISEKDNI
jgi:hypothetical protein